MKKKIALITGISGQDGCYLAEKLLRKNFIVYGGERRSASNQYWRLKEKKILNKIRLLNFELLEYSNIYNSLKSIKPDFIFNLAAQSFVGVSFDEPIYTMDANALGVLRILEAIKVLKLNSKFIQASSSEMYGLTGKSNILNEKSIFYPRSPYAISKSTAYHLVVNYRESYNLFAANAIMFNHESPYRGEEFVTKKISKGLVNWKNTGRTLSLGNIYAKRDWGHSSDYMEAMLKIANLKKANDFVISTNFSYSVKDFVNLSLKYLNIDHRWIGTGLNEKCIDNKNKTIVNINKKYFRPAEVDNLKGDSKKFIKATNWKPKYKFKDLVKEMIDYEIKKFK